MTGEHQREYCQAHGDGHQRIEQCHRQHRAPDGRANGRITAIAYPRSHTDAQGEKGLSQRHQHRFAVEVQPLHGEQKLSRS